MSTLADKTRTNKVHAVLAEDVNRLIASSLRPEYKNVQTLTGDIDLTDGDMPLQIYDCDGADRISKLPPTDAENNHLFLFVNDSSGSELLSILSNDETVTHAVLRSGEYLLVLPDGTGTYVTIGKPFGKVLTPSQVTANQNDWFPTGAGSVDVLRISTDASRDFTGFGFPAAYKLILVVNSGSNPAVFKNESASSLAANRFSFGADLTLATLQAVLMWYDPTSARWRMVGGGGGSGGSSGGDVVRTKYIITPSVATNDLTIALKYIDGNDPSSTNKLTFRVGNTEYDLTAAMSFTKIDGTNWCNAGSAELAAKNVQYFLYAIGETGGSAGLKFGFSRIPYAKTMGDFINTTTSEKYIAGNWTNFNSTDPVTVIGRFQAQLSGSGTSHLWSIPTANVVNYPIYETDVLTWQPTYSATGSMTYTIVTTTLAEYQVISRQLKLEIVTIGTTGGTAAPGIRCTLPFSARNNAASLPMTGWTADGGGTIGSCLFVDSGTANLLVCRRYDGANYGLGANRYIATNGSVFL